MKKVKKGDGEEVEDKEEDEKEYEPVEDSDGKDKDQPPLGRIRLQRKPKK